MKDKEKLEKLLKHWIEHNEEHATEFREWAAKAREMGKTAVGDEIEKAANQLDKANEMLGKASEKMGGS